jgi:hypothetical protein
MSLTPIDAFGIIVVAALFVAVAVLVWNDGGDVTF